MSSKLFAFFISFCLWQGRAVKCCFYLCTSHDTCTMASGSEDHGCSNYCNKLKYFHSTLSILLYQIQVLSRRVIPVGIYLQSQSQFKHSFNTIFLVYVLVRKKTMVFNIFSFELKNNKKFHFYYVIRRVKHRDE